jgi:uncharacterized protein YodC (DUF2158 family)
MEQKFKTGDVVELKSGGSAMTVAEYDQDGFVICEWFINNNTEVKNYRFSEEQLMPYVKKSTIKARSYPRKV